MGMLLIYSVAVWNAISLSKVTSADLIECIGHHINSIHLWTLKTFHFCSVMSDESI